MDTKNEHKDTYRFKDDCSKWYEVDIETMSAIPDKYSSIQDVWLKHESLNVASGAICSYKLKRALREQWEKTAEFSRQVFGFEFEKKEFNRAMSIKLNHPQTKPIFPLLLAGMDKIDCIKYAQDAEIEIPKAYALGYKNNNCLSTGCVQGGIGYWQKIQRDFPEKFEAMAKIEHELTAKRSYPITMLKDQSAAAKEKAKTIDKADLIFLEKHPDFDNKCLADMPPLEVESLVDCNGFCGVDDLNPKKKQVDQINFDFNEPKDA